MNLTWLDLLVIGIPLVLILAVAILLRGSLRSVADFLAASRCASRYVICVAAAETGAGVAGMVGGWESFQKTGFSLGIWGALTGFVYFMLALTAVVGFRFRETRCLTFHQFFEVRYSKGLRVFASILNVLSGLFSFGVIPGVSARFFVYFLNLPTTLSLFQVTVPTYTVIMTALLAFALFFSISGGQISVMVTDCIEGVVSNIFYLVVAAVLFTTISYSQMLWAFTHDPTPGESLVNPLSISKQQDFNGWFVLLGLLGTLYYWRGSAWNAGFTAAGKSAHESRMASIIGVWRGMAAQAMGFLVAVGAVTLLRHPDFAARAQLVADHLTTLPGDQLQRQMRVPTTLGLLLPSGARGALCAIGLFGTLAGLGNAMHGFGSTLVQDMILPNFKRRLTPKAHLRALKWAMAGIAVFSFVVSAWWTPPDYLQLALAVISALYLGGVGAVVWGGLYWRRATTQGAWTAMVVGALLATGAWFLQTFWHSVSGGWALNRLVLARWADTPQAELNALLLGAGVLAAGLALGALAAARVAREWRGGVSMPARVGAGVVAAVLAAGGYVATHAAGVAPSLGGVPMDVTVAAYLRAADHWTRFPINGQILSVGAMGVAGVAFVGVSLLTARAPFNLERMLHRGEYALTDEEKPVVPPSARPRWSLGRLIGIDEYYTRGDRLIHLFTFYWGLWPNVAAVVILTCNYALRPWTDAQWFGWHAFNGLFIPLVGGVITTVWFTYGTTRDLFALFRTLPTIQADADDDGTVRGHRNLGEPAPEHPGSATRPAEGDG